VVVYAYNPGTGGGAWRQEDQKLEASLGYIVRTCLEKKFNNKCINKFQHLVLRQVYVINNGFLIPSSGT
jgi:hypothetical protein